MAARGSESLVTVITAFAANLVIAVAKTIAAMLTGSASMVAESAHSWADTGNEIFLLIAERRSRRPRDPAHPLGFGKDAYIWSMFAAFGLFTAGAVVSIQHGIQEVFDPEPASDYFIAYIVLALSFVLEGVSFLRAYRQARRDARERRTGTLAHVLDSSNPTLRAVFAEDAAALIGLGLAFLGVLLHQITGSPYFDAAGSILVGVLLGIVAVVLIGRNRQFLLGQTIDEPTRRAVLAELLERADIDRVTYLHMEYTGPGAVFLVAAVDLVGDKAEHDLAGALRTIEADLERDEHVAEAVLTLSAPGDPGLAV
jgi:cation diffusion facilitator family transporter